MFHWLQYFFYFMMLWHSLLASTLVLKTADFESQKSAVANFIEKPVRVHAISFTCDVACSQDELRDLVSISAGQTITAHELLKALSFLIQKNKFQTITVTQTKELNGISLHFDVQSFWTLSRVKIKGISIGRDSFRQYYLIELGDRFDDERHAHSLEHVKAALMEQGYCNADVRAHLAFNAKTKTVTVDLHIALHEHFRIGAVDIAWQNASDVPQEYASELTHAVGDAWVDRLISRRYSKAFLNRQAQWLKDQLHYRGFFHSEIQLIESFDHDHSLVNVQVRITVHSPRHFVFFGNHFFSSTRLLDQLQVFGSSLSILPPSVLAHELEQLYHKKGFFQTQIVPEEELDQSIFLIDEGQRARINDIVFTGMAFFTPEYARRTFFKGIIKKSSFDNQKLDDAFNALISAYQEQGFWDARIGEHHIEPQASNGHCLFITIDEGPQCCIEKVIVDWPLQELENSQVFAVSHDTPCDIAHLTAQRNALERQAEQQGIILSTIKPQLMRQDDHITVHWCIELAQSRETFGKTIITGCPAFAYHYITRELAYQRGEPFDTEKIKRSVAQLRDLDIFESIQITPGPLVDGARSVLVKLHEDDPRELKLRWGFGLQQMSTKFTFRSVTYSAGGVFKIKNPFQRADHIALEVDYKRGMHSAVLSYDQPWIVDLPLDMKINFYTINYQQPGWIEIQHNLYDVFQQGSWFALMHKKSWMDIGMNIGFEFMKIKTTSVPDTRFFNLSLARALNFVPALLDRYVPYVMAEPTLMIDLTDNKVSPTKGTFTLMTIKTMIPVSFTNVASYFVKFFIQQSVYIPVYPLQLLLGLRVGHIFQRDFSSIMPNERFYLGGANSIRSYQTDSCPPLGVFCNDDGQKVFVPQGARSMINGNVELRLPIYAKVEAAVFQDVGALNNTMFTQIRAKDVLAGTGFGLRYATPIGPLRFDIAWKWRRDDPAIAPYAWYVTFGSVF